MQARFPAVSDSKQDNPESQRNGIASGGPSWDEVLRGALSLAPDPEVAGELAGELLGCLPPGDLHPVTATHPEVVARVLYALCGIAPFFAPFLKRHPDALSWLLRDDLSRPRERDEQEASLEEALSEDSDDDDALRLRRFKYTELARITVRDCCDEWVPLANSSETLSQLSQLADVLLSRALRIAAERVAGRHGPARWTLENGEEVELAFSVIGLGKLGSEELNFSSDVDLVYIFEAPPSAVSSETEKPTPSVYFTQLAQEFGSLLGTATREGFLYRPDLDLRPQGAQGTLVISGAALAHYFGLWADTWEKAAYMKARPVAGDLELGWRVIRSLDPMTYRSTMDYAAVHAIRSLKDRVEEQHGHSEAGFNVKIDRGGIRDVEFVAQALQLLHGARIPQVRSRSTQVALQSLAQVGLLPQERVDNLLADYRFLRRIENRLQMEAERQVHLVPKQGQALTRLARSMGYRDEHATREFEEALQTHRERVLELFSSVVSDEGLSRIFELFARNVPHLVAFDASRKMIEALVEQFGREIEACSFPGRALNSLDRFIHSVGRRRFYYELLLDRPELVPRLVGLFASSKYLSNYLASNPRLIEPVFEDPDLLLPSKQQLREHMDYIRQSTLRETEDPVEAQLDALRLFHHRETINVGLLDIAEKIDRASVEGALSDIAETCLEEALEFAAQRLAASPRDAAASARGYRFIVVAMGKLASRQLSYGSDLDLVFVFDTDDGDSSALLEAQEYFIHLSQRLISTLQAPTARGSCYEIDTRLRPSGNQGMLVASLASFEREHTTNALLWQRQALLRARPVAGDPTLARDYQRLRLDILRAPLPDDSASEIHHVRQRMEKELARETPRHRNLKTGRGGALDVEAVVQHLRLRHGSEHPELLEVNRLETHLARLQELALIDSEDARRLREGWEFLQHLGSRLRIVENRSISDLDVERDDLDGLARSLGYRSSGREAGARRSLLSDYQRHTEAIRSVYLEALNAEDWPASQNLPPARAS